MEQYCGALFPGYGLGPICLKWFHQAIEHCTALILYPNDAPGTHIWTTLKNYIFPKRQTGVTSEKIEISVHPKRFTLEECNLLFSDIVHNYLASAPRYAMVAEINELLLQIMYSLMGITTLGLLLVATICVYRRFVRSLQEEEDPLQLVYAPEKRARAFINHNMRVAKYELQRLHVRHFVQPEEIFPADGTITIIMKVSSKLKFVNGCVSSNILASARVHRLHKMLGQKRSEYKLETMQTVMRFINSCSRKLRLLFIFDEDPYCTAEVTKKGKNPPATMTASMGHVGRVSMVPPSENRINLPSSPSNSPRLAQKVPPHSAARTQIPRHLGRRHSSLHFRRNEPYVKPNKSQAEPQNRTSSPVGLRGHRNSPRN